ncbi:MAG TPA: PQQ-dependent sugar dehydrogenase [Bacteroidales bacterium]|nr:PQQ-dependent sugar dehydrogenase [Bacteroidales bacterium]
MKTIRSFTIVLTTLSVLLISSCSGKQNKQDTASITADSTTTKTPKDNKGITLPDGFSATVFADKLGGGRHIAVAENGNVYLALSSLNNGAGIAALRDKDNDGHADITEYFVKTQTTGMAVKNGYLYYSNAAEVYRVPLSGDELVPKAEQEVIATGFERQNQHQDKTFTLDNDGNIYVNVGAPSNACQERDRTPDSKGIDPCPQLKRHAGIWRFKADKSNQDQVKDGHRYASGIRNSVAITWNPNNNMLYVVQHGRDQLFQFYPALFTEQQGAELPAEEFLQVNDGDFFGWPYCYYDQFQKTKLLAPEYGGDTKTKGRCTDAKNPILAFPGHLAPNALLFYTGSMFPEKYKNGAFIAFHGSWNRAPQEQKGYFVVFVPFRDGQPAAEWEVFADGFAGVKPIKNMNEIMYRPTGLAQGPDGSLYISDSEKGRIWKVVYNGQK